MLRHARLSTTLDIYIQLVDEGLGDASVWDEILPFGATMGPTASVCGRSDDDTAEVQEPPKTDGFQAERATAREQQ